MREPPKGSIFCLILLNQMQKALSSTGGCIASAGVLSHFQQFLRPADLFRRGGNGIGQGIGDAQLLPLEQPQRMVGQHLHPLHRFQAADEVCGPAQALLCLLYTLRAHETGRNLVCRLLLEKKKTSHLIIAKATRRTPISNAIFWLTKQQER